MGRYFYFASGHSGTSCGKGVVGVGMGGGREFYVDKNDKVVVFVLCHNDETLNIAGTNFASYSWARPHRIPTTYIMESIFYTNLLPSLMDTIVTPETRWVGTLSWKAHEKTNMNIVNEMLTNSSLQKSEYDVLGFFVTDEDKPMSYQIQRVHPGLMEAMEYILLSVGETAEDIKCLYADPSVFKAFYANYMVVRPSWMRRYLKWLYRVIIFMNVDARAQKMIWADSTYNPASIGSKHCSQDIYNRPYYPFHPFIGERLAPYFFHTRKANILTIVEYSKSKKL